MSFYVLVEIEDGRCTSSVFKHQSIAEDALCIRVGEEFKSPLASDEQTSVINQAYHREGITLESNLKYTPVGVTRKDDVLLTAITWYLRCVSVD